MTSSKSGMTSITPSLSANYAIYNSKCIMLVNFHRVQKYGQNMLQSKLIK